MLTRLMEGRILMAPDDGGNPAVSPVDYGNQNVTSAPDTGNAVEQAADNGAVGTEGTQAANEVGSDADKGKAEGQQSPAWMAQLPKDLRSDPELARHRTMGEAIKYLKEKAEGKTSEEGNAGQTDAKSQEKVPVKYENFAKKLNESNDPFGTVTESIVAELQRQGLDQASAESIVEKLDGAFTDGTSKLVQEGVKHTEAVMHRMWGRDYDTRRRDMAKGYAALDDVDGSLQKRLDAEGASLSPAVWELISRVGRLVSEDSAASSRAGQSKARDPEVPVEYKY